MDAKMRRRTTSCLPSEPGLRRIASEDGRLAFTFTPSDKGHLYVERIQVTGPKSVATHSMLAATPDELSRALETDQMRFVHPGLYQKVMEQAEEFLDGDP